MTGGQQNLEKDSGFTLVSSRNRRHRNRNTKLPSVSNSIDSSKLEKKETSASAETVRARLEEAEEDIRTSSFFNRVVDQSDSILTNIQDIICLGLGNFADCVIARYQLAFIRCLQRALHIDVPIKYFDPVFTDQEVSHLTALGGIVCEENLEGKYLADRPTLLYLPHCPKQIVNNALWKNWSPENLSRIFLICNSFGSIVNNTPSRILKESAHYILRITDHFIELPFENRFKYTDIFNDTSLHYFNNSSTVLAADYWDNFDEPHYNDTDTELITKSLVAKLQISHGTSGGDQDGQ